MYFAQGHFYHGCVLGVCFCRVSHSVNDTMHYFIVLLSDAVTLNTAKFESSLSFFFTSIVCIVLNFFFTSIECIRVYDVWL